ncbi:MAG: hypothetical protein K9H62_13990 [Bacteroidales bacterium]|nr:hypothetical protein [Bacteroidales bacterium]
MKNKKSIYILLPIVVIVWGLVFYQIYNFLNRDSEDKGFDMPVFNTQQQEKLINDTFNLILDYPDPFIKRQDLPSSVSIEQKENKANRSGSKKLNRKLPEKKELEIAYKGFIRSKENNSRLEILVIDGKPYFAKKQIEDFGIKIESVWNDSIQISFDNKKRILKK